MSIILETAGLFIRRGASDAVRGVGFRLAGPGWFGIIGANGSGKTSLLRGIGGRLDLAAGSIVVDGIDRTADRAWRARHFGFAPEGSMLPDALTPRELYNVTASAWEGAMTPAMVQLQRALGINVLLDQRIGVMSAGMRQRVAIFSAFVAADARQFVLLDEPFNWLDPVASYDVKSALQTMVAGGLTLLTALHDLNSMALSCKAGMLMANGQVVAELSVTDLAEARLDLPGFERAMMDRLRVSSRLAN